MINLIPDTLLFRTPVHEGARAFHPKYLARHHQFLKEIREWQRRRSLLFERPDEPHTDHAWCSSFWHRLYPIGDYLPNLGDAVRVGLMVAESRARRLTPADFADTDDKGREWEPVLRLDLMAYRPHHSMRPYFEIGIPGRYVWRSASYGMSDSCMHLSPEAARRAPLAMPLPGKVTQVILAVSFDDVPDPT